MRMGKIDRRVLAGELFPQLPYAKATLPDVYVVEQDAPPVRKLRKPHFEVVLHCFIRVEDVNVQQIDGAIGKIWKRLIEGRPEQA